MCGRFLFTSPPDAVARAFDVDVRHNFPARYNIAPTQPIAVIHIDDQAPINKQRPIFNLMRWGFIPGWAKAGWHERMGGKPLINARSETVAEKPTFRAAWRRRRCLIPANGFYEWRDEGGTKRPFCIKPANKDLFAFAGIWETATDPDGGEIDTVAVLTTSAGPGLGAVHCREPVVIDRANINAWLGEDERDVSALLPLLTSQPLDYWHYFEVSADVSNSRNEGARLAEPVGQGDLFQ